MKEKNIKVCPELHNGKTLCDLWDLLKKYNPDVLNDRHWLNMSLDICAFIGTDDLNLKRDIEKSLNLKKAKV